jgi:hypothetical protein
VGVKNKNKKLYESMQFLFLTLSKVKNEAHFLFFDGVQNINAVKSQKTAYFLTVFILLFDAFKERR